MALKAPRALPMKPPLSQREKVFPTGSKYKGTWDTLGMSGIGLFTLPNGVVYDGDIEDGRFHGKGELQCPGGEVLQGRFDNGRVVERTLVFADGLHYNEDDWNYCHMPDRRFTLEYEVGVQPAFQSILTGDRPTRTIPLGLYDTGDGFFDPETGVIYRSDDIASILRSPSDSERQWIDDNCRKADMEQVGPRQDLYEKWAEPLSHAESPPLPQVVTRATEYLFQTSESCITLDDDSDTRVSDYNRWLRRQKASFTTHSRSKVID